MVANAGYKAYATGDVLTAAQVQYNLQNQTVMYFATSAARTTALTGVTVEGMVTYIPANGLEYYNGSAWITLSTGGDITGVTAGTGITGGGTSGTVTVTNDMATTITTAGDLIRGTGSGTYSRLGIGSTGDVLTVASGQPAWAAPASSGGMTLLSTTAMSTGTTTVSSISGSYKDLVIYVKGWYASADTNFLFQVNTDTTAANYQNLNMGGYGGTSTSYYAENNNAGLEISVIGSKGASNNNFTVIRIPDYANATTRKIIQSNSSSVTTASVKMASQTICHYGGTIAAISSISCKTTVGTWSGGSIEIYGVK
jgi:hypothetical protein